MGSVFVDLASHEEQASELLSYFEQLKNSSQSTDEQSSKEEFQQHTDLLKKKNYTELLSSLIDFLDLLFERAPENEIENCLNLLSSLLRAIDASELSKVMNKLIEKIASKSEDKPLLRLKLLGNLYNFADTSSILRCDIFCCLLTYALETNNILLLQNQLDKIDLWLKQWGTNNEQKRQIYLLVRQVYQRTPQTAIVAHQYLVKYLSTFENTNECETCTKLAETAAVEAIKLPEIIQCDELLNLQAMQQLELSNSQLYALLTLFSKDNLDAFHTFHTSNPNFIESVGLVYEDCLKKMRLLSLASLATQHTEVPYSKISSTLSVDESDVEKWIFTAISANILDAKMDQNRRMLIVNRTTQRVFTKTQWEELGGKLQAWKNAVNGLLETVQQNRVQAQ